MGYNPTFDDNEKPKRPRKPIFDDSDYNDGGKTGNQGGGGSAAPPVSSDTQSTGAAFGQGISARQGQIDYLAAANQILDASGKQRIRFNDFSKGIITVYKRGGQPRGSLLDSLNFVPNKAIGALVQRTGYAAYITIGAGLTDQNAGVKITSISNRFVCGAENPESKVIDVVFGTSGATSRWLQNPFYNKSATATAAWMQWGESQILTCTAIAADKTTITFATTYAIDNYYTNWIIKNSTAVGFPEHIFITGFVGSTGVATTNEKIPIDWVTGDTYTLYRSFHDNPTFLATPVVGSLPNALPQGNAILASGGQSSNANCKFIWSGYIDQTFFPGATKSPRVQCTYVTEAEIKSTSGFTFGNQGTWASVGNGLDVNKRWFMAFLYETVDGQLSSLQKATTNYNVTALAVDQGIQTLITIDFPLMNKRIRKLHCFIGNATFTGAPITLPWEQYFHVKTIDLTATTPVWIYTESVGTPGQYTYTMQVDNTIWQAVDMNADGTKESLVDWTGTSAYNRSTLSADHFRFHNNRLFVAKSYDYNLSTNLPDTLSFSDFSPVLGTPQYNVLPDIYGASQAYVEQGDPNAIQTIGGYGSRVLVFKDRSVHEIDTTNEDPIFWQVVAVSREIGCDLPLTYCDSPHGAIWGWTQTGAFYVYNGTIKSLVNNTIQKTFFKNLSGITAAQKLTLWGWWSPTNRSYRVMTLQSDLTEFYEAFPELPVEGGTYGFAITGNPAWYRNKTQHSMASVGVDRNGTEYFASTNIYSWGTTNLTDAGTAISTALDTGQYLISERNLTSFRDWFLAIDQDSAATIAGTLDCNILIDGVVYTFDNCTSNKTAMTRTRNRFHTKLPIGAYGRTIQFQWNQNVTPAKWTPSGATAQQLSIYELSFDVEVSELVGDVPIQI